MTCKELETQLIEDIGAAREPDLKDHIGRCKRCEKLYRELLSMEELSDFLRDAVRAPEGFAFRVHEERSRLKSWKMHWRPVVALCALLLVSTQIFWPSAVQVDPSVEKMAVNSRQIERTESLSRAFVGEPDLREANRATDPQVDVILGAPSESGQILRVPSRIEIRHTDLHHDFYLNHVSH